MAGLLTFPQSALPSQPSPRPVTFSKQTLCLRGLQLQVQFRTLTGFPCIAMAQTTRLPQNFAAKVQHSSPTTNQTPKKSKIKKKKCAEYTLKNIWFSAFYWSCGPVLILSLKTYSLRSYCNSRLGTSLTDHGWWTFSTTSPQRLKKNQYLCWSVLRGSRLTEQHIILLFIWKIGIFLLNQRGCVVTLAA